MISQAPSFNALSVLTQEAQEFTVGSVGSPSSTTQIVIDILQSSETSKILGQLVYLVVPQDEAQMAVIGQVSEVETRNRWHEDLTFRGIIKRRGHLPHLSGRADVRTAVLTVQACFAITPAGPQTEEITEGILGISPSTGTPVYRMRDEVLEILLERYASQIIYLGYGYGTGVRMPFWLKHFGEGEGGIGEAYHIGVFGKTGSGKSGLAAYMLLGYARHSAMSIIFIDPQGQFSSNRDLPFDVHGALRHLGRPPEIHRLSSNLRLPPEASLFGHLLDKADFFRHLGVSHPENRGYASQELRSIINDLLEETGSSLESPPQDFLRPILERLLQSPRALRRIYATEGPRRRMAETIEDCLSRPGEFRRLQEETWQPALDLFLSVDSSGHPRTALNGIIRRVMQGEGSAGQPLVFLDISGQGTRFSNDEEVKAIFLREISRALQWQGEQVFQEGRKLNCLVFLDEAHRFARARGTYENTEVASLTQSFVDAVRTTRKYGLGYMFITQTLASLHPEIVQQLRLNAFGYGLTMGSEYARMEELVGDRQALSLYRSFVDPQSTHQYPFMFTGPISPLSFTGAPLFVQVYTSFEEFAQANPGLMNRSLPGQKPAMPRRQVEL